MDCFNTRDKLREDAGGLKESFSDGRRPVCSSPSSEVGAINSFSDSLPVASDGVAFPQTVVTNPNEAQGVRRAYVTYMNSAAWRTNRQVELDASGNRCRGCNRPANEIELQVHHRTYENFGNELPGDLTTLCIECHYAITTVVRRRRYAHRTPVIGDFVSANCAVALFDPQLRGEWT